MTRDRPELENTMILKLMVKKAAITGFALGVGAGLTVAAAAYAAQKSGMKGPLCHLRDKMNGESGASSVNPNETPL
jgi:hypothetical protein